MVLAWLLFASTGIIISRYYKKSFWDIRIFGKDLWFVLHRPLMTFATILTLIAFIVILSQFKWLWVVASWGTSSFSYTETTHSIVGMFVIGLSFFQVINEIFFLIIMFL